MATITLGSNEYTLITPPASPGFTDVEMTLTDAVAVVASPFVPSQVQTQSWPGADAWSMKLTLPKMNRTEAAPWRGFLAAMRGMQNVVQLGDPQGKLPRGLPAGAPVANNCIAALVQEAPGSGYTHATATITGGGGSGAAASVAIVSGGVVLTLTNRGDAFTSAPAVSISGDGTGAAYTAQIANTLNAQQLYTRGWTPNQRGLLMQSDYLQIGYRMHMVADEQVNADSNGDAAIWIFPGLRDVPTDGEAISLVDCKGVFRLAANARKWSTDVTQLTDIPLTFVEVR